jgi:hypothetical protein
LSLASAFGRRSKANLGLVTCRRYADRVVRSPDSLAGNLQVVVAVDGSLDQAGQNGILETRPKKI